MPWLVGVWLAWTPLAWSAEATDAPGTDARWRMTAEQMTWTPQSVQAADGALLGHPWRLGFEALTLDLATHEALVERARFTTCAGTVPIWSVSAARARYREGGPITFVGGWFRLGRAPLVPLPVGAIPTETRSARPLMPRLAWTDDGLLVAAPIWIPLSPPRAPNGSLTLTPEWRQERGWRGLIELSNGAGDRLGGAVGWDRSLGAWRGSASIGHGSSTGPVYTAARGLWISDEDYLIDYGDDLLARSTPWTEQRWLLGVGPFRATLFGWQLLPDAPPGRDAAPGAALSWPTIPLGPARLGAQIRADGVDGVGGRPRFEGALSATTDAELGPLEWTARADGRGFAYADSSERALDGTAGARLLLPAWADHGAWRHEIAVGGAASVGGALAGGDLDRSALDRGWPGDAPPDAWSAGPLIESRWWSERAYAVLEAAAPFTPDGPGAAGRARLDAGPWSARLQASTGDPLANEDSDDTVRAAGPWSGGLYDALYGEPVYGEALYGAGISWSDEVVDLWARSWWLPETLDQIRAGGAVRLMARSGWWRPSAQILARPGSDPTERVAEWGLGLGWTSACGCMAVATELAFAEDRALPQVGLSIDLGL